MKETFVPSSSRHFAILLVVLCYANVADNNITCSDLTSFVRVDCFEDFGVTAWDILDISRKAFYVCGNHCSRNIVCMSYVFDGRYNLCVTYRERVGNETANSTLTRENSFLNYGVEDACNSVPVRECYVVIKNTGSYVGRKRTTLSGVACQRWDEQIPHNHTRNDSATFPDATLAEAENFCRDPDQEGIPWCYTMDPDVRYKTCGIPLC